MAYTSMKGGVGSATRPCKLTKNYQNYTTRYFTTPVATGYDMRVSYDMLEFTSTGGGEVTRNIAYVNGTSAATGGTINAQHNTLRLAATATVSGAANAARFTVEGAAGGTPGGTIGVIQIDNNLGASATVSNLAGIRFTKSGSTDMPFAMAFDDDQFAKGSTATSADGIKIRWHDGTTKYIMVGS